MNVLTLKQLWNERLWCSCSYVKICFTRCFHIATVMFGHYDTLNVPRTATSEEIKQAYFKKCKELHPDMNSNKSNSHENFTQLNEAYSVLGNPLKRKEYDQRYHSTPYSSEHMNRHYQKETPDTKDFRVSGKISAAVTIFLFMYLMIVAKYIQHVNEKKSRSNQLAPTGWFSSRQHNYLYYQYLQRLSSERQKQMKEDVD